MSKEHLATYLNDHLAGSNIALEILDHLAKERPDLTPLAALRTEIDEDREELKGLMARLSITESRIRQAGTWIAEQVAEAKIEADDDAKGPLRLLERLEALAIGIDGKLALWRALNASARSSNELSSMDYERLVERALKQRAVVEALRLHAASLALAA